MRTASTLDWVRLGAALFRCQTAIKLYGGMVVDRWSFRGMALMVRGLHHADMYTSLKRPRVGDRVRLTGFLGVFEVVRVRPDGSLVDLKHLDLHQTDYIEQEVSAHDLIYVRGPEPASPVSRPAQSVDNARQTGIPAVYHRSTSPAGVATRTPPPAASSALAAAGMSGRRRDS
jgi:hypothetical protein